MDSKVIHFLEPKYVSILYGEKHVHFCNCMKNLVFDIIVIGLYNICGGCR